MGRLCAFIIMPRSGIFQRAKTDAIKKWGTYHPKGRRDDRPRWMDGWMELNGTAVAIHTMHWEERCIWEYKLDCLDFRSVVDLLCNKRAKFVIFAGHALQTVPESNFIASAKRVLNQHRIDTMGTAYYTQGSIIARQTLVILICNFGAVS